jgi:hypothetical protein
VHCFGHNPFLDHCDSCFPNIKCIKGDLNKQNDFICLCGLCQQGRFCEFILQAFSFTIDTLLNTDSATVQSVYIDLVIIMFSVGLLTNFCSFVTFKRPQPRNLRFGNYLFIVAILNQCSLACLLFKFIHILQGSVTMTNDVSCKTASYLLSVCIRSTYWLMS